MLFLFGLLHGQGELEEQSQEKMERFLPNRNTKTIEEIMLKGFERQDTVFINWEKITKKGSLALKEAEKKNVLERIKQAKNSGIKFMAIIDEEHRNDTDKANAILNAFEPEKIVRVSATPRSNNDAVTIKIKEIDVINSGLITRAIFINENIENNMRVENEIKFLLDKAIEKRNAIRDECIAKRANYNPLVIIQFPSMSDRMIKSVEDYLSSNNYTYDNGTVAKWMSDEKENVDGIKEMTSTVDFLLFKQAINTGWDCPRAKILVKLRENMNEEFEIQTIGRIRRMPEARHYNNTLLDNCYLYTFDEDYKSAVKTEYAESAEAKMIFLKDEYKSFSLIKEYKDSELSRFGNRESAKIIWKYLCDKYQLTGKKRENVDILTNNGFNFSTDIISRVAQGREIELERMNLNQINIRIPVNTHEHGLDLKHAIGTISSKAGMTYEVGRQILERLFMFNIRNIGQKILSLNKKDFYAFIINNEELLKDDIREAVSQNNEQMNLRLEGIKEGDFSIPTMDILKYDSTSRVTRSYEKNVYEAYINRVGRSTSERLFEDYCERNEFVKWWYKNGESAQQYFSIIYLDSLNKSYSFYPDYILTDINDNVWIIETKGGQDERGNDRNIDIKVESKYTALVRYSKKHNINFGFVREINEDLFILQSDEYISDMNNENWIQLDDVFKN